MKRVRKFFALCPTDRRLIAQALFWVGIARASLWLVPFRTVRAVFARWMRDRDSQTAPTVSSARIAWAITAASRVIPHASCLTQALAALVLLNRYGYSAELKIGVALKDQHALHAHAWVESNEQVIIGDTALDQYTPLAQANALITG
jgi:hypothetical protein